MLLLDSREYLRELMSLRAEALANTAQYPQYAHTFDDNVLVNVTSPVTLSGGSVVEPGLYLASPVWYWDSFTGAHRSVWKRDHTAHAAIPLRHVEDVAWVH